jgi:hypothetical protein
MTNYTSLELNPSQSLTDPNYLYKMVCTRPSYTLSNPDFPVYLSIINIPNNHDLWYIYKSWFFFHKSWEDAYPSKFSHPASPISLLSSPCLPDNFPLFDFLNLLSSKYINHTLNIYCYPLDNLTRLRSLFLTQYQNQYQNQKDSALTILLRAKGFLPLSDSIPSYMVRNPHIGNC